MFQKVIPNSEIHSKTFILKYNIFNIQMWNIKMIFRMSVSKGIIKFKKCLLKILFVNFFYISEGPLEILSIIVISEY